MKLLKLTILSFLFISLLGIGCSSKPTEPILGASELAIKDKLDKSALKDKYQAIGTSLKMDKIKNAELDKYTGEPKDEIKVTLGSSTSTDFEPSIEMKRWNEVKFKLKPNLDSVETKDKKFDVVGDKIKFDTPKISFEMYEAEYAYKYVWYLNKKPTTNTVSFQIESEGLDFFYQPPLNEEYQNGFNERLQKEIIVSETQVKDLGGNVLVERPIDVVSSYAVYHQTKGGMVDADGKDYKTGKAFHILRPHIIDAVGNETWGKLHIENGIYTVEIPQAFLDSATYPIKSNDTIGYTVIGASNSIANSTSQQQLNTYGTAIGTLTKIQICAYDAGANSTVKLAVYSGTSTKPTTLVSNSYQGTITVVRTTKPTQDSEWTSSSLVSSTLVAGNNYWNSFGQLDNSINICYDSGVSGVQVYQTTAYGLQPSATIISWTNWTEKNSIYFTYTPSGGTPASTYTPVYLKPNTTFKRNVNLK